MNTTIREFCQERKLTQQIEDAFVMYCRSTYAQRFALRNGETVQSLVNKLNRSQVSEAWNEFVREMKDYLS
jgi:hypothetical protein